MKVEFTGDAEAVRQLRPKLDDMRPILELQVGKSAPRVTAIWECLPVASGRVRLTVKHWMGEKSIELRIADLKPGKEIQDRFFQLWSDLVHDALDRQWENMEARLTAQEAT
jgi:hypothetical protein